VRDAYAVPDPRGGIVTECLAFWTAAQLHGHAAADSLSAEREARRKLASLEQRDSTGCAATSLAGRDGNYDSDPPEAMAHLRRAAALAPEVLENWSRLAGRLAAAPHPDRAEVEATLAEGLRHVPHPLQRATLYEQLIALRLGWNDAAGARRLTAALLPALARDGRPGLRLIAWELEPTKAWTHVATIRAYTAAGDWHGRWWALKDLGKWHLDHGNPAGAIPPLDSAVWLAESKGQPWCQLIARMQRGRAEARLGRTRASERDLRAALAVGARAPDAYYLAETWHNLAHLYEGAGRWPEAAAAADSFVALTRPMRYEPLRMMSLHDAGMIRWKAGWHAAAAANFAEMVRVVDDEQNVANYYWAGEYFERTGDLARALAYYQAGASRAYGDQDRPLAGLVRVFEALGKDDSATRAAAAHDSLIAQWTPLEHPLLPRLLSQAGRSAEAVGLAATWAERQLRNGNVEGAALATLEVADLSLAAGKPAEALAAAARADSLAHTLHLVSEIERAAELRGDAEIALGDRAAGLAALTEAAALAQRHPTVDGVLAAQLALGDGLAAAGRAASALAAYDRAVRTVEAVTERLPDDLDRVGYRDRHLRPFDGALRVLLATPPSPARTEALALWSQRRKAAALALATAGPAIRPQPLAVLQQRLDTNEALIDYVLVARTLAPAALVVTRAGARLVPLGASADSISAIAARLTRPLRKVYGGQLDLGRARFDLAAAALLYQAVLAPLRPALRGATRLVIAPDGALCGVPFAALVSALPAAADSAPYLHARYVLDDFEVAYVPSAQWLRSGTGGEDLRDARLLVLVRDVPGGAAEATAVRAAWPDAQSTILADTAATERAVRRLAPAAGIVHFATHAEANDADPLASHLRLAPDAADDGYFHLNEIAGARLRARLIVLSACATLTGRLAPGEGLLGLARAFLVGGAQGVLATEWPVGGATALLMGTFYGRLAGGARPAAALRDAELALRRDPRTVHPFYWGGVVLLEGTAAP